MNIESNVPTDRYFRHVRTHISGEGGSEIDLSNILCCKKPPEEDMEIKLSEKLPLKSSGKEMRACYSKDEEAGSMNLTEMTTRIFSYCWRFRFVEAFPLLGVESRFHHVNKHRAKRFSLFTSHDWPTFV